MSFFGGSFVGGLVGGFVKWLLDKIFGINKDEKLGRLEQEAKQHEKAEKAQKQMENTKRSSTDDIIDSMRDGEF